MENQNVNVESTSAIVTMERRDMKKITTKQTSNIPILAPSETEPNRL